MRPVGRSQVTRHKKKLPADTTWPPAGVRDLKPDVPVNDRADRVRFPTLREALERKGPQPTMTTLVNPNTLTEPLVRDLLRSTRSRTVEYLCRAYLQFGGETMSDKHLESLCDAVNASSQPRPGSSPSATLAPHVADIRSKKQPP